MNEFFAQFILESRDLIEQASSGLLTLQRAADDAETVDSVFRAFHTLKGGASIVDFTAMERAVHTAEDVLSRARSGDDPLTDDLIASCLACLDQASRWLDMMELSGEVPAGADVEAGAIVDRISRAARKDERTRVATAPALATWADAALQGNPHLRVRAKTALRFTPRSASFFQGADPFALIAAVPKLLWLDAKPVDTWPALDQLDPFESILVITALTASSVREVGAHLQDHATECEIVAIQPHDSVHGDAELPANARKLIEAQLALLDDVENQALTGRMASAGVVVANVLRYCGQSSSAERILQITDDSVRRRNLQALRKQIADVIRPELPPAGRKTEAIARQESSAARTLRVDADRVDALVRLTGELTVVKNAIGHAIKLAKWEEGSLAGPLNDHHGVLEHLVGELQRAVLAIRVLPLRTVLQRFPRVVREMSASLQKPVSLVVEGDETEADKAIVDTLFEPLLHIVRNAMDHGIESSELREQRGKPDVATIRMRASRDGANVLIEVEDDGGGIDVARVREVAKKRGVVKAERLDAMSDGEVIDLVFTAGLSTAANVTELSGRGVGMDAVRTAVERFGGRVAIESRSTVGTTVRLTLPFSAMMTHVMTVEAAGQMFGIPLDAVIETIRVPTEAIAGIGAAKAIVHRDRTIPIFRLADVLRVQDVRCAQDEATVVIASVAGQLGGIQVDRLGERMEVMLKPLDGLLAGLPELAGTTILGDGRVLLVLDLGGVLQ